MLETQSPRHQTPSAKMAATNAAAATSSNVKQPTWYPPQPMNSLLEYWQKHYPLRLQNSMTRTKTPFVPMKSKRVLWYMCGPTVYDQTHLGHGRTYTCFDYVRRILEDYFGYEVELVMNITDIDDKIIIRAAEGGWLEAHPGQELPANKDERTKVVMQWASEQPAEDNMRRTKELSKYWEKSFLEDMASLNIKTPAVITRVSEYVEEIVEFVEGIIKNGYGYESNGSVYFDTEAFNKSKGMAYGKLLPENVGQSELLAEGEGSLSLGKSDKRNQSDFVLWKKSKKGEPFWSSPWGEGRPGWHIECSAMASDTLKHLAGGKIDIHSGGIDLRFPHHDNEIAQSEAYFNFSQWVNYFVHTGHLNIEGLKMSKSLKNFVKIQEALMDNTSRQLRFLFLLHKYNVPMDYNDNSMDEAVGVDRFFSEFFQNVKVKLRELGVEKTQKWGDIEKALNGAILECKENVHIALSDDLNTPLAIAHLQKLAKEVSRYMASDREHVSMIIRSAAEYITSILRVFGLIPDSTDIGFPLGASGQDQESVLAPVLDIFAAFRDEIREAARAGAGGSAKDLATAILRLCDDVRDERLPHAGVRLEDRAGDSSIWKLANKEELLEEMQKKADEKLKKEEQKRLRLEEEAKKKAELEAKAKINPAEMFLSQKDKFSKFDGNGLPTHDAAGEPIAKAQLKKLAKEQEKQKKLFEKAMTAPTSEGKRPNVELARGINAFSANSQASRNGRFAPRRNNENKTPGDAAAAPARTYSTRKWYPADYIPRKLPSAKTARNSVKPAKLRKSITPGTVLILLSGRFRGKRVVFLKQLPSGTLLITGPYKVNGVPLRRVNQAYVIATSTKVDLSGITLPDIDDSYFAKEMGAGKASREDQFFDNAAGARSELSEQRKQDQKAVDTALMAKLANEPYITAYLNAKFTLTKNDRVHELRF
ncbi:TPA: hypothetical protein N0F65_012627 [Lagenidium giganteum]|uniref:60S ribosomal protein L6 n=1 Tax=Lagenidium giganteum TaxID=4803 RepID=A0AAV2YR59_9STRA|nr:TPA: hypothetical protein N0F65_012627 [Lagenidium giganteum]